MQKRKKLLHCITWFKFLADLAKHFDDDGVGDVHDNKIIHVSHHLERLGIKLHVPTLQESALFGRANTIMMYSAKGAFCLRSLT